MDVLDSLKPPEGVVLPPREIRNILEKTAGFVARNGGAFEERVRDKERANPKFSFLSPDDAYHAFYRWRLTEIREGRGTAVAAGRAQEVVEKKKEEGPPRPVEFVFSARMPPISQKDLDVIRMTALFVARNGGAFRTQITQREASKAQFQFLMPNHTFYNFFQHLVEQYTTLIQAAGLDGEGSALQSERMVALQKSVDDKYAILARARERAQYAKFQRAERAKKEEEENESKLEFARIDWNDFVVVEQIVFDDADDHANLPPPTSLSELQYASLEDRKNASIGVNMRIEEALPTDEIEEEDTTRAGVAAIKIRDNYVPRAARAKHGQLAMCPNCKQMVALDEMEEHMRIELLDPAWKDQKAKADARNATTNLSTVDVANNLKRLASQRADVFDNAGQPLSEDELARRKKQHLVVQPDVVVNVEEQIRLIHQKFADKK